MAHEPMEDRQAAFTRLWSPVVRALVQSGASAREWACLTALMRFQDGPDGILCMSVEKIARETGLSEDGVRHALSQLLSRRYVLSDGHELPIIVIRRRATRSRATSYHLCVPRSESPGLMVLSKADAREMRARGYVIPYAGNG